MQFVDCGAEFTARSTLYVHAKRHNVETASVTFPCEHPGCNKQYSGKSNLRKHMVRCHGQGVSRVSTGPSSTSHQMHGHLATSDPSPPELVKIETASPDDYITLLLDDDQSSADRSIVTFISVSENLQVLP